MLPLIIFQYFVQASLDITDKFLIAKRKIQALNYTFYTVVSGVVIAVVWPWVYYPLSFHYIVLDIFSGVLFSAAAYIFYKTLEDGEASRVVPFVYGLVPVFDIVLQVIFKISDLRIHEVAAMCLMIPGALLLTYKKGKFLGKHVLYKLLAAVMISSYNLLWHYSSHGSPVLNSLIWNRIGATGLMLVILLFPAARKNIFNVKQVENKKSTSILFLVKQLIGGSDFVLISFLYSLGSVPVVDALQGFRYIFLLGASIFLHRKHYKVLDEDTDRHTIRQKMVAISLIFVGTIILFSA